MATIPTPHYFNAGDNPTFTDMNAWNDHVTWGITRKPAVLLYHPASSAVATTNPALLNSWAEWFDNDNMHTVAPNLYKITFQTAGLYQISARVVWLDQPAVLGPNNTFRIQVALNNAGSSVNLVANTIFEDSRMVQYTSLNPFAFSFGFSDFYHATAGDTVEMWVLQTTGANRNVLGGAAPFGCTFSAHMVSTLT